MRFKTVKKGYEPLEVNEYIKRLRGVYDKTLIEQRDRIFEQRDCIEKLEAQVAKLNEGKSVAYSSLEAAVEKSQEIEQLAVNKYSKEITALREFHEVWVQYFARIKEKYPITPEVKGIENMSKRINKVLGDAETFVPRADGAFKPINMIENMLAASELEDEGVAAAFDYNEAQNPDDELEDILGDLGISFDDNVVGK